LYTQYPFYGSRRIHRQLQREGEVVGENTVAKYMRQMGIRAIYPGPNLSKRVKNAAIYPYLLRNVTASYPNHIWGIDITYIRLQRGWLYLVAVIDWYSRFIISWELDDTLEIPFVLRAVDRALTRPPRRFGTVTKVAISPALNILTGSRMPTFKSVWTVRAGRSITFLLNGCGARSNTRRSI